MWSSLVRLFGTTLLYYTVASNAVPAMWSAQRLRNWLMGAGLLVASGIVALVGIIILISSLFFQLAELSRFVTPALITGGVSILVSILGMLQATRYFRRH